MAVDEARVEELVGQLAGPHDRARRCALPSGWATSSGYYRALAGAGALDRRRRWPRPGCNPRLTREWLDGQAAAGLVAYDAAADTLHDVGRGGAARSPTSRADVHGARR